MKRTTHHIVPQVISGMRRGDFWLFLIPLLELLVYLLSFYPGIMSVDSVNQWAQLSLFSFSNWHPAYHTILMWLITRLWYSPAAVALAQILGFSMILGYTLRLFGRDLEVPRPVLLAVALLVPAIPMNGIMLVTLWKDIPYSLCVLLLTAWLAAMIKSNGIWLASGPKYLWLALVVASISLLRQNGLPVAFGTLLACLLFRESRTRVVKALAFSLILIAVIVGPIYAVFHVEPSSGQGVGVALLPPLAAHVDAGTSLTPGEGEFLNEIRPFQEGWAYLCHDISVLVYSGVDFQPLLLHPAYAARTLLDLTLKNPAVTLRHFACSTAFVWQLPQPTGSYLETILLSNTDPASFMDWHMWQARVFVAREAASPNWEQFRAGVAQRSNAPAVREAISHLIQAELLMDPSRILWRPALYLYALSLAITIAALRTGNMRLFLLLVPGILQSLCMAFAAPYSAVRYQYPVYVTAMVYLPPLIFLAIRGRAAGPSAAL